VLVPQLKKSLFSIKVINEAGKIKPLSMTYDCVIIDARLLEENLDCASATFGIASCLILL